MIEIKCLYSWQFYFLIFFVQTIDSYMTYKTILLEDPSICSPVSTRAVKFDSTSALNLTQVRFGDHSLKWSINFKCHFRLKPGSKYNGIIVVVQELNFRRNESTGECIDYVQFKTEKGRTSQRICGSITANIVMNSLYKRQTSFDAEVDYNTFISDHGELDVYIYISKEELQPEEYTNVKIIFTLYKYCYHQAKNYEPCVPTREICINKDYFNDGVYNCPFFDCVDEGGCTHEVVPNNSIGNKVLIGSVTSLVLIFVIFILCLYIYKKQGRLCWNEQFSNPNTAQTTRVIEMNESPNQSENAAPSAPALGSNQEDKDLPPSYDSLFPSR